VFKSSHSLNVVSKSRSPISDLMAVWASYEIAHTG